MTVLCLIVEKSYDSVYSKTNSSSLLSMPSDQKYSKIWQICARVILDMTEKSKRYFDDFRK